MKKRILSALLSVCMLLTLLLTPAMAANEDAAPTDGVTVNENTEPAQKPEEQPVPMDTEADFLDELPAVAEEESAFFEELPVLSDAAAIPVDAMAEDIPAQLSAEPEWVSGMVLKGYDLFTKEPSKLPDTAEGKYLVLAQSGVEGDTAVYALYLNPTPSQPNNGVVAGQGVLAARLGRDENGELAGYLAGSNTKVTLDKLLLTAGTMGSGYTLSNGGNYLNFSGTTTVGAVGALEISSRPASTGRT